MPIPKGQPLRQSLGHPSSGLSQSLRRILFVSKAQIKQLELQAARRAFVLDKPRGKTCTVTLAA